MNAEQFGRLQELAAAVVGTAERFRRYGADYDQIIAEHADAAERWLTVEDCPWHMEPADFYGSMARTAAYTIAKLALFVDQRLTDRRYTISDTALVSAGILATL